MNVKIKTNKYCPQKCLDTQLLYGCEYTYIHIKQNIYIRIYRVAQKSLHHFEHLLHDNLTAIKARYI